MSEPLAPPPAAQPVAPAYGYQQPRPTNSLAIVSLVSAFFISLVAVITGHIALRQIARTGEGGRGLAIAGLIIGYLSIVATVVYVAFFLFVILASASSGTTTSY
jgi:uncharacterized BrkB/YihY/UPF0761 family membrane protein